jgi:hypothetical protein
VSRETSVNFYQTTRRYNPEDSHLYTRRRENLKSYFGWNIHWLILSEKYINMGRNLKRYVVVMDGKGGHSNAQIKLRHFN